MKILVLSMCAIILPYSSLYAQGQGITQLSQQGIKIQPIDFGKNVESRLRLRLPAPSVFDMPLNCSAPKDLNIGALGMYSLAVDSNNVGNYLNCVNAKENKAFSFNEKSCSEAVACLSVKIKKEIGKESFVILNEAMAFDFAKNSLYQSISSMERMEVMKAFARKKFDDKKLGNRCPPKFQKDPRPGAKCNYHMLEAAFKNLQETCKIGSGCYNNDDNEIDSYKTFVEKKKTPELAFVLDYPNYRVQAQVEREEQKEAAYLGKLAALATNATFMKLKPDQKADKVLEAMGADYDGRVKDPILAYDFAIGSPSKASLKKSKKFQEMMAVFTEKKLTEESFIKGFDKFRQRRASAVLGSESVCKEEAIIPSICNEMTQYEEGSTNPKSSGKADLLSSRFQISKRDSDRLKDLLGKEIDEKDIEVLLNAKRCISYEIYNSGLSSPGSLADAFVGERAPSVALPNADDYEGVKTKSIYNLFGQIPGTESGTDYSSSKSNIPKESDFQEPVGDSILSDSFAKAITNNSAQNFDSNSSITSNDAYNNSYYNSLSHKDDEADKKDKQTQAQADESYINPNASSAMDTKIADLESRLNEANKKLAQIKIAGEEAEAQRENQKKIDAENEKIKDLRAQLDGLKKAQQSQVQSKAETSVARVSNQSNEPYMRPSSNISFGSSSSESRAPASRQDVTAPKTSGGEIRDSKAKSDSGSASAISSVSSASKSAASNLTLTGSNSAETRTITAVDGMSAEKVTQTISSRIIELKGIPFYIEEGGMVKEIIPVLKDGVVQLDENGNPLYEKIVKGKATDKKFAKVKESGRAPAAITSTADLKRDQEDKLKRERAEYIKLKDLTNGVLKKK